MDKIIVKCDDKVYDLTDKYHSISGYKAIYLYEYDLQSLLFRYPNQTDEVKDHYILYLKTHTNHGYGVIFIYNRFAIVCHDSKYLFVKYDDPELFSIKLDNKISQDINAICCTENKQKFNHGDIDNILNSLYDRLKDFMDRMIDIYNRIDTYSLWKPINIKSAAKSE